MNNTWEPGIGDHLRTIWRYKWFLLGGAIVAAELVFLFVNYAVTPRYEAEASLRLTIEVDGGLLLDGEQAEYASRIYAELAESPALIDEAVDRSGLDIDRAAADADVTVQWTRPPGFIDVTASAESANDAAALADGMARTLVAAVASDASRLAGDDGDSVLAADIVEPAAVPTSPAWPRPVRDTIAAFIIALVVLAEAVALWRPARGLLPVSRTAEVITELFGIPALTLTGEPDDRTRLGSFAARHLAATPAAVLVQCGGDPRPAVPVRLGEALTAAGRRTLIVDGDPNDPSMHWWLSLPRGPGLEEVTASKVPLSDAVFQSAAKAEVSLLTAGGKGSDRESLAADEVLDQLTPGYDFVVVYVGSDSPLDGVAASVAQLRHSSILVVDPQRITRRRLAEQVHGFGGHEDVVAILLMTKAAASAETKRLSTRSWKRKDHTVVGPSKPRSLGPFRTGRRAS